MLLWKAYIMAKRSAFNGFNNMWNIMSFVEERCFFYFERSLRCLIKLSFSCQNSQLFVVLYMGGISKWKPCVWERCFERSRYSGIDKHNFHIFKLWEKYRNNTYEFFWWCLVPSLYSVIEDNSKCARNCINFIPFSDYYYSHDNILLDFIVRKPTVNGYYSHFETQMGRMMELQGMTMITLRNPQYYGNLGY